MKNKQKLIFRACPRCRGDLLLNAYDGDFGCLQCGRRFEAEQVAPAAVARKERVLAA